MAIRITGMNSGLDTESIITQLVSAQSAKKNSLVKAQTTLSWKMDAWKSLNSKIYSLYTGTISKMRFSSAYTQKKTTVSNPSVASVVTGGSATDGVQTLKVTSLAKSGYLTGASLKVKDENNNDIKANYTSSTKLSEIYGVGADEKIGLTLKTGGKETAIELTGDSTVDDLVKQLKSAGVNASFDTNYQRFFISSAKTGKDADFSLTANNDNGFAMLTNLGINVFDDATVKEYKRLATMSDADQAAYIATKSQQVRDKEQKTIEDSEEAIEKNEKLIDEFFEKSKDPAFVKSDLDSTAKIADVKEKWEKDLEELKDASGDESKIKDLEGRIKNLDTLNGYVKNVEEAKDAIDAATTHLQGNKIETEVTNDLNSRIATAGKLVSEYQNLDGSFSAGVSAGATRIQGKDAEIELNGAVFESSSNTFEINGLTITAQAESEETVTLTTSNDYDGIYNTIKDFLKGYNELINEMDKLYNAESAKGYSPLMSDEKEAMTDKEIEEWETKIKDSILRRDSTVNDVARALEDVMAGGITVGGKTMYLSSFGINTLGYFLSADNEKHAYHIDGDKDDLATAGNPDVLMGMIAKDPDTVMNFFQNLANNLYTTLTKKMGSTSMSSIYKAYNDKQMQTEYDAYKKSIAEQEQKLRDYEDKWYNKFSAMEVALSKINSKSSALAGLLG